MAERRQALIADAQLKALRRIHVPVAWLNAVQSAARVLVARSQSETRRSAEGSAVNDRRGRL